jgi:hypothetical protein
VFNWFKIFNITEFAATGLVSRSLTINLTGIGQKEFLITKGNLYGLTVDGVFLAVDMNENNPNELDGFAVYKDANQDVWWGIEIET